MDQIEIGKFIQQLRKEIGLTQKELSNKLDVSDKIISKWETGNGMPELSLLKPLSDTLGITINELLNGEKINEKNLKIKYEESIVNTIKYSNKIIKENKINAFIIIIGICFLVLSLVLFLSIGMKSLFIILALLIITIGIIINYNNSEFYINEDNNDELHIKKSLIYNAISTFILIDNVDYINYNFSGTSYQVNRKKVIENYSNFEKIIINNNIDIYNFNKYVTEKIKDETFVNNSFEKIFNKKES